MSAFFNLCTKFTLHRTSRYEKKYCATINFNIFQIFQTLEVTISNQCEVALKISIRQRVKVQGIACTLIYVNARKFTEMRNVKFDRLLYSLY